MNRPRVRLVGATFELLDAAIEDPPRLGPLLSAAVAQGWAGFPEALPGLRRSCAKGDAWGAQLFVIEEPRTLVGLGGYKGAPREGIVEIGYAIAPAFRGRGLATEVCAQMIHRAFADHQVRAVDAHTLAGMNPSTRVLEKLLFRQMGEIDDPDDGKIWHWRLRRTELGGAG
jgi:ribosomal-protein-alanine N-acetyltransferase